MQPPPRPVKVAAVRCAGSLSVKPYLNVPPGRFKAKIRPILRRFRPAFFLGAAVQDRSLDTRGASYAAIAIGVREAFRIAKLTCTTKGDCASVSSWAKCCSSALRFRDWASKPVNLPPDPRVP